jgi:hypothetical protein
MHRAKARNERRLAAVVLRVNQLGSPKALTRAGLTMLTTCPASASVRCQRFAPAAGRLQTSMNALEMMLTEPR